MWRTLSGPQTIHRPKGSNNEVAAHHCRPRRGACPHWSLPRQLAGGDPTREAAQSTMSRQLRPRLEEAIRSAPASALLRGRLRPAGLRQEWARHSHRRQPAQPDEPRHPVSEGAAIFGSLTSLDRLIKVLYRAPVRAPRGGYIRQGGSLAPMNVPGTAVAASGQRGWPQSE
jgi:hypothetical protein